MSAETGDGKGAHLDPLPWPPRWALRIRDFAAQVVPKSFTGKITINFSEGSDGKVHIESWTK